MGEENDEIKSGKFTQEDVDAYTRRYTALKVEPILADKLTESEFREDVIDAMYFSSTKNPEYGRIAAEMLREEVDRKTPDTFCEAMRILASTHPSDLSDVTILDKRILPILDRFGPELDQLCKSARKIPLSYNGLKTLIDGYLEHVDKQLIERPEYMWMRVSLLQVPEDLESTEMYAGVNMSLSGIRIENGTVMDFVRMHFELQAGQWATQASPTMFNAWKAVNQCASCFLTQIEDSMDGIYSTLRECALISQRGGGIGISINRVRAGGSVIAKSNGRSQGTPKMLTVYNATAMYANQGGRRKGAFAVYMSPDHADFPEFLEMRLPTGNAETRSRDLHHAIWMPDLFMKRVQAGEMWSFFCPNEAPGLCDVWGDEYEALYSRYEREGRARFTKPAMDVWCSIIDIMCRTSEPYLLFKDHCNRKSNHQHLGTIQSSNLCTEIIEHTSPDEIAVCNLASVALAKFVTPGGNFDFEGLEEVVGILTVALDNTIDRTFYPVDKARVSNLKHRPIGIGVQALSDVFLLMGYSWGDEAAIKLQDRIFESIYFAFLRTSCNRARVLGTYESYKGSPVEKFGMLQHDMWNFPDTDNHDWEGLRADIAKYGLRNSLGVAPMPTVSTALIMDNTECIEPITSLMAVRRTKSGEFIEINKHLVRVLDERGLLDEDMMKEIKAARNSVQNIERIPPDVRHMFRTAFEIPEKTKLAHHVAMAKWVDQSFSRSMFVRWDDGSGTALQDRVSSALFAAWRAGLKTGMYYLRIRPEIEAAAVTVEDKKEQKVNNEMGPVCKMEDGCLHCSS